MKSPHTDTVDWGRISVAALIVSFYPTLSFAAPGDIAASSVGGIFCNVYENVGGMTRFISALAYIVGGSLAVRGIFDLIKRSSDPNKPLKDGLLGIMAGGMVAALPSLVEWLHRTIFKIPQYRNVGACSSTPVSETSAVPLDVMLMNFVTNIKDPIMRMMSALAIIFGASMIFYNMIKLSKFGADAKSNTLTPILGSLIIGALLMAVGQTMDVSLNTLFGGGITHGGTVQYSTIAYDPGGTSFNLDRFNNAMKAVFIFLYIIGSLSFIRGFFILRNALEGAGQATKGQAFTHIVAGTLLVNMPNFIRVIETTMGFDIIKDVK